jgi:hypothetical protein
VGISNQFHVTPNAASDNCFSFSLISLSFQVSHFSQRESCADFLNSFKMMPYIRGAYMCRNEWRTREARREWRENITELRHTCDFYTHCAHCRRFISSQFKITRKKFIEYLAATYN